jgi:hypothetical protein
MNERGPDEARIPFFRRGFFGAGDPVSRIGFGEIGGKARGLVLARDILEAGPDPSAFPGLEIRIPHLVVLTTDVFDAFMDRNRLRETAESDLSDAQIAQAFQAASLPTEILGDLRVLVEELHLPLAVRSSSLLEDALARPFAGVYETKMTPNDQPDPSVRFQKLTEAIKFVYASTFFKAAKDYVRAAREPLGKEKMAVILQEVVGSRYDERFYPTLSGVGRSYNFYPGPGAKREDGVVELALGLGKTIVDGGICYAYSPARPKSPPPYGSPAEFMRNTQKSFWAVHLGSPPAFDPIAETEYLAQADLSPAEYDGTLRYLASTFLPDSGRLSPGTGSPGPRVLNFAPLLVLEEYPLNRAIRSLLAAAEEKVGKAVEIEFAMTLPRTGSGKTARLGFLQVRPMMVSDRPVEITDDELARPDLVLASDRVMGNGVVDTIEDVVYVRPGAFEPRHTRTVAGELERMNHPLLDASRSYLLIGFGRWGSSDPWLGIPVRWGQISGARVIVEATRPDMNVEASQGSHFFHNISSFEVSYFTVSHSHAPGIDWDWLEGNEVVRETDFVRHVRLSERLLVKVDGRTGRGAVWRSTRVP